MKSDEVARGAGDLPITVRNELDALPPGPTMIMGDMNADTEAFPRILQMIVVECWTDVGSVPHLCLPRAHLSLSRPRQDA